MHNIDSSILEKINDIKDRADSNIHDNRWVEDKNPEKTTLHIMIRDLADLVFQVATQQNKS